ncbi:MAG: dinitrogenase iron-molybdenum cofactor biosynthesis protein [Desulfobacteraceae bacterium]|nr:dinitrogenase iron-molybdenum cofactor biosynthesis protein [Desulfobacteraceae bacterium]
MKIAITSKGETLDSEVDPRFGRAGHILIVDTETLRYEVLDNSTNVNAFKGAGIQAASMISEKGVEILMTGYCGPNAFKTLEVAGIKVVNDVSGSVRSAVEQMQGKNVRFADGANADGHW